MQEPDPKCRHFVILWHFGIFAKRLIANQIRLFRLFPPFRLFHRIRHLDFSALIQTDVRNYIFTKCMCVLPFELDPPNPNFITLGKREIAPKFDVVLSFDFGVQLTWDQRVWIAFWMIFSGLRPLDHVMRPKYRIWPYFGGIWVHQLWSSGVSLKTRQKSSSECTLCILQPELVSWEFLTKVDNYWVH